MKRFVKNLMIVPVVLAFSCTNDSELLIPEKDNSEINSFQEFRAGVMLPNSQSADMEGDTVKSKIFKFVYQNKEYSSPYLKDSNSVMIFNDQKINDLMSEIKEKPNYAVEFGRDGIVYFYDTEAERISAAEKRSKIEIFTRANLTGFYIVHYKVVMWDKPKGRTKGGAYISVAPPLPSYPTANDRSPAGVSVSNLHYFKYLDSMGNEQMVDFNDKISSMQTWVDVRGGTTSGPAYPRLYEIFYRDKDYQGPSLTFSEVCVDYTYSQMDYFESFNFDNKPTSFKIYCGY